MPEELTGWFNGEKAEVACEAALQWARDEWRAIDRASVLDVRPAVGGSPPRELLHRWSVTLAVEWRDAFVQDGLGL